MRKGFSSETEDSQAVFRQLLKAMAHPGTPMKLLPDLEPPAGLHKAAGAILLTLLDDETPLWSDLKTGSAPIQWLRFHTGAPATLTRANALFVLETRWDHLNDPAQCHPGTSTAPETGATLVIQTPGIHEKGKLSLSGPGIESRTTLGIDGVEPTFFEQRELLNKNAPLGVDMIFVCHDVFAGLPRTTSVEVTP